MAVISLFFQGDFIRFKFLRRVGHGANVAKSFDWPSRDNVDHVDDVHLSCVFMGQSS